MSRRTPAPPALLLPLLLCTLLLPPAPSTASLPTDDRSTSFVRPLPLLRQPSSPCPCQCSVTDNPKTTNVCAGFPDTCSITRCFPRTEGYGCCDDDTTEIGVANTAQEVVPLLNVLVENVADAVDQNPVLTQDAIDILGRCIFDLEGLNSGIIPDEFARDQSGARTSRLATTFASMATRVRMSRDVNLFFARANQSVLRILQYVLTELQSHIRSRTRSI